MHPVGVAILTAFETQDSEVARSGSPLRMALAKRLRGDVQRPLVER
jgi:hypothetical protein